ncbi:lipid droplet associated hydrolase sturkopf isoform X2 [Rhynchophorus ferrugineus]
MNEAFVEINNVRTKVVTWGRWIEESAGSTNKIIILIPGNPGITNFYQKFAKTLYERSEIPVWCVGHAGHNFSDKSVTFPKFDDNKHLYGLSGQVEHKLEFFNKYVPENAQVYLIGHSIGAYMCLEILENISIKNKVENAYLLFPTIEYMAESENGKFLIKFVLPYIRFILILAWLINLLPSCLATILIYIYMFIADVPREHLNSIKELIQPGILKRVFFLSREEMDDVNQRNNKSIIANVNKLKFYYSKIDRWAPESYYNNLKQEIPNVNAELSKINHSFVLHYSTDVATIVADWISH